MYHRKDKKKLIFFINLFLLFNLFFINSSKAEEVKLLPFENHLTQKYGFIDTSGNISIIAKFDYAGNFINDVSVIRIKNLYGFVNNKGEVLEPQFYEIKNYTDDNFLIVRDKNGKYGFIDKNNLKIVVKPLYEEAFPFYEDLAKVKYNNKYGFIDRNGKLVIQAKYDYAEKFSDGIAWASVSNGDTTYIDKKGKVILRAKTDYMKNFSEGLSYALINGKYGYVDKTSKKIIENKFQYAEKFHEGLAKVKFEGKFGFIDKKGSFVIKPIFEAIKDFKENIAPAKINGKWTFIDKKGEIISRNNFDFADNFSEGLSLVKIDNKYGYVDNTGNYVIEPQFDFAEKFYSGLAKVNYLYYINKKGQLIFDYDNYIKKVENTNKPDMKEGSRVCINYWDNNQGFCGKIIEVKDKFYVIAIDKLNCKVCIGGCSDNPINIIKNSSINEKIIKEELFTVEIPKDCIE
ncbi:MAG: WG repeat-containing protein [Candidatus Sericytochromatia bacterium]